MKNTNINELLEEMADLKAKQKAIIRARFLDVAELNKVNKRLYDIRQVLHKHNIKENQQEELYILQ